MKTLLASFAFVLAVSLSAQATEPVFTKVGKQLKATYFHDNGNVAQTGFFLNGKLHGKWVMYDQAGKKIAIGQYHLGKRTGKWFFWKEEGLNEVDYHDNRIVDVVIWKNHESLAVK